MVARYMSVEVRCVTIRTVGLAECGFVSLEHGIGGDDGALERLPRVVLRAWAGSPGLHVARDDHQVEPGVTLNELASEPHRLPHADVVRLVARVGRRVVAVLGFREGVWIGLPDRNRTARPGRVRTLPLARIEAHPVRRGVEPG